MLLSCNGNSNPAVPSENPDLDNPDEPGSNELTYTESDDGSLFPPGYPHKDSGPDYAPGEILLSLNDGIVPVDADGKLKPGVYSQAVNLLSQYGLGIIRVIPTHWSTVYRLRILDGSTVPDKVAELQLVPEVRYAEPNGRVHFLNPPYFPNDPLWENPGDLDNDPRTNVFEQFGPSKIGASYVWDDARGDGIVVCVIDTGIQSWHEDLEDNMWINEGEIPDNDIDDDGNGYIDDIYGWDTDTDDNDITDYGGGSYHGTACAGVVAATQDNSLGCSGIAPGAKLMGIRIGFNDGFYSAVIEGVEYAIDNGADIVSMSFITTNNSDNMRNTMNAAYAAGLLLCGGAGNDDGQYIYYPCTWDSVVKVGGTSPFSQRWAYNPIDEVRISIAAGFGWGSTYGNGQEVCAFGEHYITTFGANNHAYWDGVNDNFFGGTSNATPMVAGSFALLKSYYPTESAEWLRLRMRETADDLNAAGYDIYTGHGRVNLIRAIYGADRYAAEEDSDGFVDLAPHDGQIFDSLNAAPSGDYIDTEDLYKATATESGYLTVDLDIFTYGEDLDLEIYSDPSMLPEYLFDSSDNDNHGNDCHEVGGGMVEPGETYYIRIYTAGSGDSSAYGLTVDFVENSFELETGNLDPGFVHQQCSDAPVGWLEISVGFILNFNEIIISQLGSMPPDKLVAVHLYKDTNGNQQYDGVDEHVADGNFNNTNRAVISGFEKEINFTNSPMRFFLTIDLSGITENAEYRLALTSYKDISTTEGKEIAPDEFPRYFGPFQVGIDIDPPTWDTTTGIQDIEAKYAGALVYWNSASDTQTPPVKYNVYRTQELPFDFDTADHQYNVSKSDGGDFDYMCQITGLNNDEEYYVAVRAEDQAGNEDDNTVYLSITPSAISDPANPQIIGEFNTSGNSWEVIADPANQRVFIADYNAGLIIIDVSDPTDPFFVDQVPGAEVVGVDYDGTYVYAVGDAGLHIIDPDGPDGAEQLSLVPLSRALDVCVVDNWVYVTNFGTNLLTVDVTDPADPQTYPIVNSGYLGYGMDAQNGYLYISANAKPRVYDLSDPSAPSFVTEFGGSGAYEIDAMGDRIYVTYWQGNRFSIYDASDPANPQFVGYYISNSGSGGADIVWFNDHIYFGTNNHYIEVINVDDWGSTYEIGQVSTDGPDGLDTDGTFIYSAENEHGLKIIL